MDTVRLPTEPDVAAPDGSYVRALVRGDRGSMAHFLLAEHQTSVAVRHREVEELWYIVQGAGEMWRGGPTPSLTALAPGVSLRIPPSTPFQFRSIGPGPLTAVAVTMPPWPDHAEAIVTEGPWTPTVAGG